MFQLMLKISLTYTELKMKWLRLVENVCIYISWRCIGQVNDVLMKNKLMITMSRTAINAFKRD